MPHPARIMYVESKGHGVEGPGRIARVSFSKSGQSVYVDGRMLTRLGGRGFKANFADAQTREEYWISGPKKNGRDRLYGGSVDIDEDVREEYWTAIRGMPQCVHLRSYRC